MTKIAKKLSRSATAKPAAPKQRASRGPKAGSARSNQTAKLTNADRIKTVVGVRGGNGVFVEAEGGANLVIADWQNNAQTVKLAATGLSFAALKRHLETIAKPNSKLAKGVDSRNSPHSAKAVSDLRAANKGSVAGEPGAKSKKAAKATAPKAKRSGGRGYDAEQKLTVLVKPKDSGLAAGSGRMAKLEFAAKCKTVGAFLGQVVKDAAGKEHKCDAGALSGMLKRQHVRLG